MLKLYQGNRLEYLADLLVEIHRDSPPAPMQAETVVVPHAGMARWLSLQIAHSAGICANYRFPLPAGYIWEVLGRLHPDLPADDPYAPGVMQWVLFQLLGELDDAAGFEAVAGYLDSGGERARFELSAQLAVCFDQYLVYRPDWIRAWEGGRPAVDGDVWQAELWRRLRRRTQAPHWVDLQIRLRRQQDRGLQRPAGLPGRISMFAMPALSGGYLAIIEQLAAWMDVHLFLLNPSRQHWTGVLDPLEISGRELESPTQALYLDAGNPLLASLGRQGRDFLAALLELDIPTVDLFDAPPADAILPLLQGDILDLRDATREPARGVDPNDLSFQLHSCHSPMREVEVLYDRLLHLFERDPTLEPHQVVVMTPELETYAPYIDAVFGAATENPLPFTIADAGGIVDGEVAALLNLLETPTGRCQNDEVLALLESAAVRRRFAIEEGDLGVLRCWVEESGIRWGEDAESRRELGLPASDENSWRSGVDRMLLGYALPGDGAHCFDGLLPYARIEGGDAGLLGNFAAFVEALFEQRRRLRGRYRMSGWSGILLRLLTRMFLAEGEEEQRLQRIRTALEEMRRRAELAGLREELPLELVRLQLSELLSAAGTGGGLFSGGISFCGLASARTLPCEVLCLIGMNDTGFPSRAASPGFDLMAHHFRLGDRPRRIDDRYLFLEALLAARRCLYISYTGQDLRDNGQLPPSVLVSELLDYLERAFVFSDGTDIAARWPLRHPLQPFSADYFRGTGQLFSYQREMGAAADANQRRGRRAQPLLRRPLSEPEERWRSVELGALKDFFANPTRFLLRERLGLRLERDLPLLDPRDPFEFDYFERERLGGQLVRLQLEGDGTIDLMAVERAAGRLPHAQAGAAQFLELQRRATAMAERIGVLGLVPASGSEPFDRRIGPFRVTGRLSRPQAGSIAGYSFNALPAGSQLGLWIEHLLVHLETSAGSAVCTRWLGGEELLQLQPPADAEALLADLLALYWQGLATPLHLFPKSSLEFARQRLAGRDIDIGLARAWEKWAGGYKRRAEFDNPYYRVAFPDGDVLDDEFVQQSERVCGAYLAALEVG